MRSSSGKVLKLLHFGIRFLHVDKERRILGIVFLSDYHA